MSHTSLALEDDGSAHVDGLYGLETGAGIKGVQEDSGLTEDGLYGPKTHACLVDLGSDA
jgi:peptidoglycan hydrolase-like protein with peptidoglycan-binding domain